MALSYISIQAHVIQHIQRHCYGQLPKEACGILAGRHQEITHFFPIPNQDACSQSFSFEPRAYLDTIRQMRKEELSWLGILHSHPHSEPYPSSRDITNWHYPDLTHWIISFKSNQPRLSAYWIQHGRVIPVMYQVIADRNATSRSQQE